MRNDTSNSPIFQECSPGDCAMNIRDGTKTCPGNTTDRVTANLSYQVCTSRNFCVNSQAPFSMMTDGSTNSQGVCDTDACRCSANETCSYDRLVSFVDNGRTFSQRYLESQGLYRTRTVNANSAFCGIHAASLSKVGCLISDSSAIDLNEVAVCMNSNFCKAGIAAFYPNDFDSFTLAEGLYNIPISCVPYFSQEITDEGPLISPCQADQVAVWNKSLQQISCFNINV